MLSMVLKCAYSLRNVSLVLGLLILQACATSPSQSTAPKSDQELFPERLKVNVYNPDFWQPWRLVTKTDDRFEFVTIPYSTIGDDWMKKIRVRFYTPAVLDYSLAKHLEDYQHTLNKTCDKLQWNITERNENEIIYYWIAKDCKKMDNQYELGRFIRTEHGIHHVMYDFKGEYPADDKQQLDIPMQTITSAHVISAIGYQPQAETNAGALH